MKKASIICNFICTKDNRMRILKEQLKVMSHVFKDYNFYINYNTEINAEEVHAWFKEHIPNLYFQNDCTPNWGKITLDLVNMAESHYVVYILEDYVYDKTFDSTGIIIEYDDDRLSTVNLDERKQDWEDVINECYENNVDHVFLAKIKKYLPGSGFVNESHGYEEGNSIYKWHSSNAPTGVYSSSAIHNRMLLKDILSEYHTKHQLPSPGQFEQHHEILRQLDLNCAIPKKQICIQAHIDGSINHTI
tara:strand:- start:32 stop:772 length:741 start_codon:yes stop_codon:yes gene_type:complete